ncbi:Predicted membrane protein [Desulfonispora thiosulfatigenes DSM 11270]|uniref:Predicted membrane protein n=1 Tax=Desulfonispora thiosulfatigenes DSM 11270 TaxID=656914 RepID=A0A1W1V9J6_DESTI|nr:DUF2207 domain-containing protein [Desulfonispora thiosulfatigenes]SMB89890.1 Predicted membrane protein [Desulfonispora thiosulfatigenes DSM 11270]
MRKSVSYLILTLVLLFSLSLPVYAANKVNTMDIQAVINEDGSMRIRQSWSGRFDEGTEIYIPMNAPDYLTISELTVSDQNGKYDTLSDWNIDWSFEQKGRKCGIHNTDSGYEISFGISRYGQNHYTIEYKLDNVVGGYSDRDGVNFRFINDGMNTTPTDVTVKIELADGTPITDDIASIWGFGFAGEVVFENGSIVARTDTPLSTENHVTVLLAMDKGILSPSRQETGSFEEVREKALLGSDYDEIGSNGEEVSTFTALTVVLFSIGLPIGLIIWIRRIKKKSAEKKRQRFAEKFGYYRDLPNDGILSATYALGRMFDMCEDGAILATGMLRLIQLGCLSPVETQEVGYMGKTRETVSLRIMSSQHDKMNEYDEYLYTVLEGAAGSDRTLQAKELERFANQKDTLLRAYIQKHDSAGRSYLNQKQCLKRWNIPAKLTDLTPSGEQELGQLMGLKRYLMDFSLVAERGVKEIPIWRELLSYAMLFGIADQVAEQMKELYPSLLSELSDYSQSMATAYSYHYLLYSNMKKAEEQHEQEKRSGGGGGFASLGGGSGSIGGGSGGGTR